MAFDVEAVKTVLEDALNAAETRIGPWIKEIKDAVHAVVESVHRQAVTVDQQAQVMQAGAVKTIETDVAEDVQAAKHAVETDQAETAPAAAPAHE